MLWQLVYQSSELKELSSSSGTKPIAMNPGFITANSTPARRPSNFSLRGQHLLFSLRSVFRKVDIQVNLGVCLGQGLQNLKMHEGPGDNFPKSEFLH